LIYSRNSKFFSKHFLLEKFIISKVKNTLLKKLLAAPMLCPSQDDDEILLKCKVLSLIFDQAEKSTYVASLDQNGQFRSGAILPNFPIIVEKKPNTKIEESLQNSQTKLENFILEQRPDLIVVGASCMEARKIRIEVNNIVEELRKRRQEKNENTPVPTVMYWGCEVAKLSAKIPRY
jgi:hypothetical protein